jgi:predicted Zn finger-like uncharacterized protein
MEVRCDKCQARYRVDDARIGPQGLTMRCGKCQNTFKVMRPAAAAPEPQPPPAPARSVAPAPPKAPDMHATAMFAAPAVAKAPPPPQQRPASQPAAPAKPPPAKAETPAGDAPGRTMMFQTGNLTPPPAPKKGPEPSASGTIVFNQPPATKPPAAKAGAAPLGGATMVFGQSPGAAPPSKPAARPPGSKPPVSKPGAADSGRSTMVFGAPQPRVQAPVPAQPPAAVATPEPPAAAEGGDRPAAMAEAEAPVPVDAEAATAEAEPVPAEAAETPAGEHPLDEEPADQEPEAEPGTFDKAPPRGLLIGVAAGLALLLLLGGGLVAYRKLARRAPPPAAVETLTSAQADADKDTLASIAAAETKAKDALDVAGPRARFPEATATLARVQIQWADALNDQAGRIADKNADDPRVAQLQSDAKAKVKSAFELLSRASKGNEASPELQLAFADYYRAKRLPSSMNRYLKEVKDEPRKALVEGLALLQEDEGAAGAIPKLKAALAASPQNARIHYRLAVAHLAAKDEASARTELKETLRLSPQHERALQALEQLR